MVAASHAPYVEDQNDDYVNHLKQAQIELETDQNNSGTLINDSPPFASISRSLQEKPKSYGKHKNLENISENPKSDSINFCPFLDLLKGDGKFDSPSKFASSSWLKVNPDAYEYKV